MRLIGHLPQETNARTFSNYLYVQGLENHVEFQQEDGWGIWVNDEDKLTLASELLNDFRGDPANPKYAAQAKEAETLKSQRAELEKAYRKRLKTGRNLFRPLMAYGFGPVTFILIAISVLVFIWSGLGVNNNRIMSLFITDYWITGPYVQFDGALTEIRHGQLWRLVTPIFIHMSVLHILFNMLWLRDLGSMIEARQRSAVLVVLVVVIAVFSNLAQFYFGHVFDLHRLSNLAQVLKASRDPMFGGMSGVVYGLMGYIWLRGKFDPGSGLFLHQSTVIMMLVWLVLCYTGIVGAIANGAHTAGLLIGMLLGYLTALRAR